MGTFPDLTGSIDVAGLAEGAFDFAMEAISTALPFVLAVGGAVVVYRWVRRIFSA